MSQINPSDGRPHFAVGSALFGVFVTIDEQQIKLVSDLGFPGLELYGESYQDFAERKDDQNWPHSSRFSGECVLP